MRSTLHAREPGDPAVAREQLAGRRENAMSDKSLVHDGGESYCGVVPAKQPNKSEPSPAEVAEGRPQTKENPHELNPYRTPSRANGLRGLVRVRTGHPSMGSCSLIAACTLTSTSEVRTVCVSSASTGLCGGQRVTAVPTATGRPPGRPCFSGISEADQSRPGGRLAGQGARPTKLGRRASWG